MAAPTAPAKPETVEARSLPQVKFTDITEAAGLRFVHHNGALGEKLLPETMGSGVAFLDYDGDGDLDLFLVNSDAWPDPTTEKGSTQALYRNDGTGRFDDVTAQVGLDVRCYGMGVAVGDYDNDGDPDLYLTAIGGGHLFRNEAGSRFVEVTTETNTQATADWLTSAAFFDMDNDGDLDLFICGYIAWSAEVDRSQNFQLTGTGQGRAYGPPTAFGGARCILLRNDGGKFSDVSSEAGIEIRTPDLKVPMAKSLGVAPYDVDGDGLVDLAVANDTVPNFLFHNRGKGRFEEIGVSAGIALDRDGTARAGMGIDWAHFKNDGSLGLAIGNFANEMTALYVTDERASLQFSDLANLYGLGAPTQPPLTFGLFFFDYDLDGRLDLLSTNGHLENDIAKVQATATYAQSAQLFWNTGRPGRSLFVNVGQNVAGPDLFRPIVGRGSAYADIDGDGDLDVVMTANGGPARLFRNEGGSKNHWLRLTLNGKASNRDALGAEVTLKAGSLVQRRQLFTAKGYLSSVERTLTFGLGSREHVDVLTVRWPSGKVTEVTDLMIDRVYVVDEDAGIR
ncbi:CRTAC1 family protein [Singulisphaera acidiphila]|uniref:CRTAC1 family protein n=1 Tax=Singulisphaera acidiphila TaxID=466153 RepID=UPI001ED90591|nr:CRTAC1 family protein [Singulisphaera acidiphila]